MLLQADRGIGADPKALCRWHSRGRVLGTEARESQPQESGSEGCSYSCVRPLGTDLPLLDSQFTVLP